MAKSLLAGMTDYSHQTFDDILEDLKTEYETVTQFIDVIETNIDHLKSIQYWQRNVPSSFEDIVLYALKLYHTCQTELTEIIDEIQNEVEAHHIERIASLSKTASEVNVDIGQIWHNKYDNKEYGNKDFESVDTVYCQTRNMAANLLDLGNVAQRLKVYIGKKKQIQEEDETVEDSTINILFLSSSPEGEDRIRVDKELRILEELLESAKLRDKISLTPKVAVKSDTISKAMLTVNPEIVHFSGHSDVDGIAIENEDGESVFFPVEGLDRLFQLFKDKTKCVLLNSCYSEEQAEIISNHNMFVVGMNDSIGDDAAISFSTGFYQAIGAGKDYEFAFDMGMVLIAQHIDDIDTPTLWKNGQQIR